MAGLKTSMEVPGLTPETARWLDEGKPPQITGELAYVRERRHGSELKSLLNPGDASMVLVDAADFDDPEMGGSVQAKLLSADESTSEIVDVKEVVEETDTLILKAPVVGAWAVGTRVLGEPVVPETTGFIHQDDEEGEPIEARVPKALRPQLPPQVFPLGGGPKVEATLRMGEYVITDVLGEKWAIKTGIEGARAEYDDGGIRFYNVAGVLTANWSSETGLLKIPGTGWRLELGDLVKPVRYWDGLIEKFSLDNLGNAVFTDGIIYTGDPNGPPLSIWMEMGSADSGNDAVNWYWKSGGGAKTRIGHISATAAGALMITPTRGLAPGTPGQVRLGEQAALTLEERSTIPPNEAGVAKTYAKTTGLFYIRSDGTEVGPLGAGGGPSFYQTLKDNGVAVTQRAAIDFRPGLTLTDDVANDDTNVTPNWAALAADIVGLGTAAPGASNKIPRADHVHPTTGLALLGAANTFTAYPQTVEINTDQVINAFKVQNVNAGTSAGSYSAANFGRTSAGDATPILKSYIEQLGVNFASVIDGVSFADSFDVVGLNSAQTVIYQGGVKPIRFFTNALQRMRIDGTGEVVVSKNVGVGGTPVPALGGATDRVFHIIQDGTGGTGYPSLIMERINPAAGQLVGRWAFGVANDAQFFIQDRPVVGTAINRWLIDRLGAFEVYAQTNDLTKPTMLVKAAASQTGNLMEWRSSADVVRAAVTVDGAFRSTRSGVGGNVLEGSVSGDTEKRIVVEAGGPVKWGPGGTTVADTELSRLSAGKLQLGQVGGTLYELLSMLHRGAASGVGSLDALSQQPLTEMKEHEPTKHSFAGAIVYRTTAQSVPNNDDTTVVAFTAEKKDVGNWHDNATNNSRLTTPSAYVGKLCRLFARLEFAANVTGTRRAKIRRNGATVLDTDARPATTTGVTTVLCEAWDTPAASTDYYEVIPFQNSGAALNILPGADGGSFFGIEVKGA